MENDFGRMKTEELLEFYYRSLIERALETKDTNEISKLTEAILNVYQYIE